MSVTLTYGDDVIAIPAKALECNAGLMELRVLMVLCRHRELASSYPEGISELAHLAGCETGAIREAIAFWCGTGILHASSSEGTPTRTVKADRALIRDTVPNYSGEELAALVESDSGDLKYLVAECQRILGKMLSRTELEKLAALSDYLRLEKEYILLLVQYCARQNKRSMAYIVRTAYGLFNEGIDDYPKLDAHIRHREKYQSVIGRLRRMLGIGDRELTKKENAFIGQWIEEFGFPLEVIRIAYDITVDSIKEVSFDYMGKILESWHEAGAVTPEAVNALLEERRRQKDAERSAKKKGEGGDDFSTFRTDEFFEAALKRSKEALKTKGGQ